jgi:PleD family two-component response regulator
LSNENEKDDGPGERPRILIVDDISANIKSLNAILGDDYNIVFATDWRKGLELAGRMSPDIVLLDIMMPDMDGYEICRRLKSESETREIPVIFITALDGEADEEKGLSFGAADYITKPFRPAIVRLRVRNHLQLKLQRDRLESLTMTDGMTEIANRRRFDQHLGEEWRRCARMHIPLSAIMMDIDHFKAFKGRRPGRPLWRRRVRLSVAGDGWGRGADNRGTLDGCGKRSGDSACLVER